MYKVTIMRAVDQIERFFLGLADGVVDDQDLEGLDQAWQIARDELEVIVAKELPDEPEAVVAILEALDFLWAKLVSRAGEALQKEINDPARAKMAADIAFAIGMAKSVLMWRLARG